MSNLVAIVGSQPVTDTLVIAKQTEHQHKSILQLVRRYLVDLEGFGRVPFEMRPFETDGGTQQREIAYLNERQATLLISYMRNSDIVREFKMRLVQAFYELAERATPSIPQSLAEALRLAADKAEEAEKLALQVEKDAPKVLFHDSVAASEDACTIAQAAKIIGTGRNRLFSFLRKSGWITRHNEPYQQVINAGLMDVKISKWNHPRQGLQESVTALLTGKGLSKLSSQYQEQLNSKMELV